MKTSFLPLFLAAVLAACDPFDPGIVGFRSRSDCGPHRPGARGTQDEPKEPDLPPGGPVFQLDTTVYYSAVRFPDGYDWQRDTAYGSVPFELLLYRDFEPVLTLQSGPDACFVPDPDRHHLAGGHLYTERMADGQTRIGRDGAELYRFQGREYLVGLLEDGEDLYTLSRPAKGPGFTFRRNGDILYRQPSGTPFGTLTDPSYGPTGALYTDQEQVCFCYATEKGPSQAFYAVRDGQAQPLEELPPGTAVLDLKLVRGQAVALRPDFQGERLSEGRLWASGQAIAVTGRFSGSAGWYSGYMKDGGAPERICQEEAVLYEASGRASAVSTDAAGNVRWYGPESGREALPCHFLTPTCATFLRGTPWLALTPRDTRKRPFVRAGTRVHEVDVNGYVGSLSVSVSLRAR